jgi:N-acetylmuramoyl-L-alanine amidase
MDLTAYGYGIDPSGDYDGRTRDVVIAFQRHFRPAKFDGVADAQTRDVLRRLLAMVA